MTTANAHVVTGGVGDDRIRRHIFVVSVVHLVEMYGFRIPHRFGHLHGISQGSTRL